MKFKVGDKVIFVGDKTEYNTILPISKYTTFTITDIDTSDIPYMASSDLKLGNIYENALWFREKDIELSISYINEQKLKAKLGLSQNQDSSEDT